jgi:hypothetical protein
MSRVIKLSLLALIASVGIACLSSSRVEAALVQIDSFTTFQLENAYTTNPVTATNPSVGTIAAAEAIGSNRTVFVVKTLGGDSVDPGIFNNISAVSGGSQFAVSRANEIGGDVMIQWDGLNVTDPTSFVATDGLDYGLGNVNLLQDGGDRIRIQVIAADLPGQTLTLSLFNSNGQGSTLTKTLLAGPALVDFSFTDFLNPVNVYPGFTTVDLSSVNAIVLQISGPIGSDIGFNLIGVQAPEPAALTLVGLALVPLWSRYRRQRQS